MFSYANPPKYIFVNGVIEVNPEYRRKQDYFIDPTNVFWNYPEIQGVLAHFINTQIPLSLTFMVMAYIDIGLGVNLDYPQAMKLYKTKKEDAKKLDVKLEFNKYYRDSSYLPFLRDKRAKELINKLDSTHSEAGLRKLLEDESALPKENKNDHYPEFTANYLKKTR